jgi:hypothetical protein
MVLWHWALVDRISEFGIEADILKVGNYFRV